MHTYTLGRFLELQKNVWGTCRTASLACRPIIEKSKGLLAVVGPHAIVTNFQALAVMNDFTSHVLATKITI